jgi:hypothetical protein
MSLSELFFVRESWQNLPGFDQSLLIFLPSQRPEPQWISARNDDAVDMTSMMIWSVLGWKISPKVFRFAEN